MKIQFLLLLLVALSAVSCSTTGQDRPRKDPLLMPDELPSGEYYSYARGFETVSEASEPFDQEPGADRGGFFKSITSTVALRKRRKVWGLELKIRGWGFGIGLWPVLNLRDKFPGPFSDPSAILNLDPNNDK